jgi:riboflavin kinase / FMN adenylyltransferase
MLWTGTEHFGPSQQGKFRRLMKIHYSLEHKELEQPSSATLTIGTFDGIHLGHQKVIRKVVEEASRMGGKAAVITFQNHPLEMLHPEKNIKQICTPDHKTKLLKNLGVDILYLLNFTKTFSEQDPEAFLNAISRNLKIKKLILGYDAKIGKGREGDKRRILELSQKMDFEAIYLDPFMIEDKPVSSSLIRDAIRNGEQQKVQKLLGRRYSILGKVISGQRLGSKLGFPTANLDVSKLCLPPFGVYAVETEVERKRCHGIANLGLAPTIRESSIPILETYLFEDPGDLYGRTMEVYFEEFLRPEIKFQTEKELRDEIARDIQRAKASKAP